MRLNSENNLKNNIHLCTLGSNNIFVLLTKKKFLQEYFSCLKKVTNRIPLRRTSEVVYQFFPVLMLQVHYKYGVSIRIVFIQLFFRQLLLQDTLATFRNTFIVKEIWIFSKVYF